MLSFLQNHPFAVEAFFENSLVLTYALPIERVQPLIPECLELDTYDNQWAFVAVAMVQTRDLRPKGFPKFMGNDFHLIGYRVFVRYTDQRGKHLRGLYILQSETDKKKMEFFGNIFTHYQYSTTDISQKIKNGLMTVQSSRSGFNVAVELPGAELPGLPQESPFPDWKTARRYAGPLPFTFTYNPANRSVLIIEGVRQQWNPEPVSVLHQQFSFFDRKKLPEARLANAFIIRDIPYYWKKGKLESWKPKEDPSRVS
ncbi:DUF2071 domain-containing protein [Flavihumibacter petaseus]|uniref:DUF2071 domain-containing protein n=1 Tax=Flavihumibacter petaseus NBRC 106054 TaxID=1220578 RepID=A0A0E9MY48_9BACT|nr:DUF2071 domain-containing protein [Flavihumibacter petaseus]GAO42509.1 hypothetical protein FPE01S_01_15240 [Flavihumibacter petaseus NBRC 106054]